PISSYELVKRMGDAADNVVFTEFIIGEDPLPYQRDFVALHSKEYGRLPKHVEAIGWDAVHIAVAAVDKAGPGASNEKICEVIRGPHQGAMAAYDFAADDLNGIRLSGFLFSKLVAGQYTRLPFQVTQ